MTIPKRYEVTDEQWARIEARFPPYKTGRPPKIPNRQVFNAVLWLLKSGATWRDIPERYGSWKTSYSRYRSWVDAVLIESDFLNEFPKVGGGRTIKLFKLINEV